MLRIKSGEIKAAIIRRDVSVAKIADLCGVTPATVYRWLRVGDLPASKVMPMAIALGISRSDIPGIFCAGE